MSSQQGKLHTRESADNIFGENWRAMDAAPEPGQARSASSPIKRYLSILMKYYRRQVCS